MRDWSTACPDWASRIRNRRSLIPDNIEVFDEEADRALRIFKRLKCPDIEGFPTYAEICDQWVFDLVRVIFGAYDASIKRRMIREFFVLIPKKNGKSSVAAAIMVTAAIMNRRPSAECLLIAPTKKIADIAFTQAEGIIRLDPKLAALFHPQSHQRTITHRKTLAVILIKAADKDVITGSKATYILVDETHVFADMPRAEKVFVEIRGGLASRIDGFLLQISTQSKETPAGLFKAELSIARNVRDGNLKLPLLPIIYELPQEMAKDGGWKDPSTWALVNPNLGRSVDQAFLSDELIKAEENGASALALLASQHFNVEIGLAMSMDRWPGADYWLACADKSITLETLIERSEVAVAGIDGGGLDDLFGLAILGREKVTRNWLLWSRAWAHDDVLARRKDIAPTLRDFEKAHDLVISPDPIQPIRDVANIVERIKVAGLLPEKAGVGLDPYGVGALVDELAEREIEGEVLAAIRQGAALSPATWGMEIKLKNKSLFHAGSGLMNWCVGNAKTEVRGGAVLITKQSSGRAKIDPLVASFNAAMLMSRNPVAKQAPSYKMFFV